MAVVISAAAMAPNCTPPSLHGSSRLSRASSGSGCVSMPPPPPPPALAKKTDPLQDPLFTEEELQALMSGQCELLSLSEHHHRLQPPPPSPSSPSAAAAAALLSLQLQAQLLCREPPLAALDGLDEPISDEDIERLAPLFCDEEIQALRPATSQQQQQASSMHISRPRSDGPQCHVGKKRRPSSPPWPSCIADDNDGEVEQAGPSPSPPPAKKAARTKTRSRGGRREREERSPSPPPIKKKARRTTQTKTRSVRPEHAAARAERLRRNLRKWHNNIATRVLTRQFRAPPELSRGRTALRCQCTELAAGFGACALHQDAVPEDSRAWMLSSAAGQALGHVVPIIGGPGRVLVPAISAGNSKAVVLQYQRWRRSVSMPSRFFVQHAVEKKASSAR